jgi:hypothetical protein
MARTNTTIAAHTPGILSFWFSAAPGTSSINVSDAHGANFSFTQSISTSWTRYRFIVADYAASCSVDIGDYNIASAGSATVWGGMFEAGAGYPSSVIPTGAASATRNADTLSGSAASLAPGGYLDWTLQFAPNFAQNEQGVDAPLIWLDAQNQVYLRRSDSTIVFEVGGSPLITSAALTFAREQVITVHVVDSPGHGASLSVAGAAAGNGTMSAAASAMSTPAKVYILGDSSGGRECVDLQKITILGP